jgi:hypothetical protein
MIAMIAGAIFQKVGRMMRYVSKKSLPIDIGFATKPRISIDRESIGCGHGMKQALSMKQHRALPKSRRSTSGVKKSRSEFSGSSMHALHFTHGNLKPCSRPLHQNPLTSILKNVLGRALFGQGFLFE